MQSNIIDQELKDLRGHLHMIYGDLQNVTQQIGHKDLIQTVADLINQVNEPFLFVIVGEVKAGKSSFVNALLGAKKPICEVAPDPCTDRIQQIIYGENEGVEEINEHLVKISVNDESLKEIAIVDTPGTNTISDHHQEITERFVPGSDMIIFVFEAKNPYRQSAWDFFDFIHSDWRKKVIFVLQQKDLLDDADLKINEDGVRNFAIKKGILEPQVFSVSAKMELNDFPQQSGFIPIKAYINDNVTGGKAPYLKLNNTLTTAKNISLKLNDGLSVRKAQLDADINFRTDIKDTLDQQEKVSKKQVDILQENLLYTYDHITKRNEDELKEGLGFVALTRKSFMSIFSKKESPKEWFDNISNKLERDLQTELRGKLETGVVDIAESIQQMAKIIDLKIKQSKTILKNDHEIFGAIADNRSSILQELQEQFQSFLKSSDSFYDNSLFPDDADFSPNLATGGGIAIIGVIITALTQGMVFDITGGIITTLGFLFAGLTVAFKRGKIIAGYSEAIANGRKKLEVEVQDKLDQYIAFIKSKIDSNFTSFDKMLQTEEKEVNDLDKQLSSVLDKIDTKKTEIQGLKQLS